MELSFKEKRFSQNDIKKIKKIFDENQNKYGIYSHYYLYDGNRKFGVIVGNQSIYFEKVSQDQIRFIDNFHKKEEYIGF